MSPSRGSVHATLLSAAVTAVPALTVRSPAGTVMVGVVDTVVGAVAVVVFFTDSSSTRLLGATPAWMVAAKVTVALPRASCWWRCVRERVCVPPPHDFVQSPQRLKSVVWHTIGSHEHDVCPALPAVHLPGAHSVHVAVSAAEYLPLAHVLHEPLPSKFWNWPAGQPTQWFAAISAALGTAGQSLQLVEPLSAANLPPGHTLHAAMPEWAWYVPIAHVRQALPGPAKPGQQWVLHWRLSLSEAHGWPPVIGSVVISRVRVL
jgi:hypothetical protein